MIQCIRKELRQSGFDLCHPIHTSWYNNIIKNEGLVENGTLNMLPEPQPSALLDDGDDAIYNALLVGNTKTIWPVFLKWLESKVEQNKKENGNFTDKEALEKCISPFDMYICGRIDSAGAPTILRRSFTIIELL